MSTPLGATIQCAGCPATVVLPFRHQAAGLVDTISRMTGWAGFSRGMLCPECAIAETERIAAADADDMVASGGGMIITRKAGEEIRIGEDMFVSVESMDRGVVRVRLSLPLRISEWVHFAGGTICLHGFHSSRRVKIRVSAPGLDINRAEVPPGKRVKGSGND